MHNFGKHNPILANAYYLVLRVIQLYTRVGSYMHVMYWPVLVMNLPEFVNIYRKFDDIDYRQD